MSLLNATHPQQKSNNLWMYLTLGLLAFLVIAFSVWFILTPYIAVWNMQTAAKNKDAESFSSYIDYSQLRENLKAELSAQMLLNMAKDEELKDNPFSGLATAAAPALMNNMG